MKPTEGKRSAGGIGSKLLNENDSTVQQKRQSTFVDNAQQCQPPPAFADGQNTRSWSRMPVAAVVVVDVDDDDDDNNDFI